MKDKKMPKPTPADYEKRDEFRKMSRQADFTSEMNIEELAFLNSIDWGAELFSEGSGYGLKTALGEVILSPLYEDFRLMTRQELKKGDRVVARHNAKWGVLICDGDGTWVIEPGFDYIGYPNQLTHVCKDGKWGVLDISNGKYLIEPDCEMVYDNSGFLFCNRIGFYKKDGKYGVIGDWGSFTEPVFEEVDMEPDGYVKVNYEGEWGYIGEDNKFTAEEDEAYYCFSID